MQFYLFALTTPRQVAYTYLRRSDAVDAYLYTHRRRKLDMTLREEVWRQSTFPVDENVFDMRPRVYRQDTARLIADKAAALGCHGTLMKDSVSPDVRRLPSSERMDHMALLLPGEVFAKFVILLRDVPWRSVPNPQVNEFYPAVRARRSA